MSLIELSSIDPDIPSNYEEWKSHKLSVHQAIDLTPIYVDKQLSDPDKITQVLTSCQSNNFAFYECIETLNEVESQTFCKKIARVCGLTDININLCAEEDGLSLLRDAPTESKSEYIPYTNKAINWHTDGYYNSPESNIRAFTLHCVTPSKSGGENKFVDPDLIYIALRDENPDYIKALMRQDVMNIPANISNGEIIREAQNGPVFSFNDDTCTLQMRYTARTRSIEWRKDKLTQDAIRYLQTLLQAETPNIHKLRLKPGQGLVCNNILHTREAFVDGHHSTAQRLYIRGRYPKRVSLPDHYANR